jgi:cytochrome P450
MDAMMDRIVAARRRRGAGAPPDVLDMMIAARDPGTGAPLSRLELRNNMLGFIIAGHETTALALTWALYLLAFDAAVQRRARAAAQDGLGDRAATAEDVPRLGYIRQVLDEAMRLYPPASVLSRTAKDHDMLHGRMIRPGKTVMVPVYALHRHRLLWDDPDAFDPGRFAPEAAKRRHRFAYIPFGAGPRICIGLQFALTEAVIVLATLLARFEFRLVPGFAPKPELALTLRPATGMPLRVTRL